MLQYNKVRFGLSLLLVLALMLPLSMASFSPIVGGQPNRDCAAAGVTPGHSASAPGSAFNPSGTAGMVYAGQQPQNSNNPMSVSQYDVACYNLSIH